MPSVRIFTTQTNLDLMAKLMNLLSSDMFGLDRIQENFENEIMLTIAKDLSNNGNVVKPEDIEVHWFVTQRSRNAPAFGLELVFSEFGEEGDPGYRTTPFLRKFVRDSVLLVAMDSKMLPRKATVGVWVRGQQGGTYVKKARP